jgi:hypothetical protein
VVFHLFATVLVGALAWSTENDWPLSRSRSPTPGRSSADVHFNPTGGLRSGDLLYEEMTQLEATVHVAGSTEVRVVATGYPALDGGAVRERAG